MREWRQPGTANGELETKTNTATNEEWLFQYDALGNLVSVGLPNGDLVEYLVDGMGRRVGKSKNGVLLKQWIYRDALKPVAELDGSGNLVAQFAYGSKKNVPDYVFRGGTTYRVVSDQLGSPRYAVNVANSGDVPFTATYTSFGEVTGTGLEWMPFGFAGGGFDADSKLVRFGARDFDPIIGRWTTKDPIGFDGDGSNLYVYGMNDPINGIDATGKGCGSSLARAAFACGRCAVSRDPLTCASCGSAASSVASNCGPEPDDPRPPAPPDPGSCGTEGAPGNGSDGSDPIGGRGGGGSRDDGSGGSGNQGGRPGRGGQGGERGGP